jgi:hypothetical protein
VSIKKKKRSGFEERMGAVLEPAGFSYEPHALTYTVTKRYTPDFVLGDTLVEAKGWFRPGDRQKYKAVVKTLLFQELVFLLQYPNKKVQKGAKLTMAGWCNKEGIRWFEDPEAVVTYAKEESDANLG